MRFDNPNGVTFEVSQETRTIKGLAVPFGDVAESDGLKWSFSKGSLQWSKVKLLNAHDWGQVLGVAELEETDEGVLMSAKVAPGPRGDEVLALAEMGAIDGLSIGLAADVKATRRNGINYVTSGTIREVSTTPIPAFENAAIRSVAAAADITKENESMDNQTVEVEAPAVSFSQADVQALAKRVEDLGKKVDGLAEIKVPVAGTAQFQVREEPMYRFSGTTPAPSGFDFATDLLAAAKDGDMAALERVKNFTSEYLGATFADEPTTTGDVSAINPSQYRPDMFLGQAPTPPAPLFGFFRKGTLTSVTPFFYSKLDRNNTDVAVADHTEGTDPEAKDLVTTSGATVTPSAVSGRVHITREVADQGGNPHVSGLIWNEFERSFSIALETKTAALVVGSSATELGGSISAGETDGAAAGAIVEAGLAGLQFLADGFRFERIFGHIDLYKLLAGAEVLAVTPDGEGGVIKTGTGRKIYPIISPSNTTGQAASKWAYMDIGGFRMYPTASLGATNTNQKSYVADPNAVHVWNSGLTRLEKLGETVEGWDLGCFAYFAGVVYDVTGLRKITYDVSA